MLMEEQERIQRQKAAPPISLPCYACAVPYLVLAETVLVPQNTLRRCAVSSTHIGYMRPRVCASHALCDARR